MKPIDAIDFLGRSTLPALVLDFDGAILWYNQAWTDLVQTDSEGRRFVDFVAERDRTALKEFDQLMSQHRRLRRTMWLRRADGDFLADGEGVVGDERVLVTFRDVTRPDLDSSSPLPLLEEFAEIGHWRTSPNGLAIEASTEVFRIFGLEPQSNTLETQTFTQNFLPDEMDRIAAEAARKVEAGLPFTVVTFVQRGDGSIVEVEIRGVAQHDENGEFIGTFGTIQDISARSAQQRREAAKTKVNALSTFAAGVTHEMNTPLAVIATNVAYIREQLGGPETPPDLVGALDDVLRNLDRARSIVEKLRPIAHLDHSKPDDIDVAAALRTAVEETAALVRPVASVELRTEPILPTLVGNRSRFVQALISAMVNAAQAIEDSDSERGLITLTASTDGPNLVITIGDDGVGIAPELHESMFDPFFTTRDVGAGSGLGLTVLRNVVAEFDGTVSVDSRVPGGTTLTLRLPLDGALRATPIVLHRPNGTRNESG